MKLLLSIFVMFSLSSLLLADETWLITNIRGYTSLSPNYEFEKTSLAIKKMIIVITDDGGSVSNSDAKFMKLDSSTLIGFGFNEEGYSLVEVYQINKAQRKLQLTQTRINTNMLLPNFPDKAAYFIGDAELIEKK
jgi:hypothetical protein